MRKVSFMDQVYFKVDFDTWNDRLASDREVSEVVDWYVYEHHIVDFLGTALDYLQDNDVMQPNEVLDSVETNLIHHTLSVNSFELGKLELIVECDIECTLIESEEENA